MLTDEEDEDEEDDGSAAPQAAWNRAVVELDPAQRGTRVELVDYQMGGNSTLQVETLSAQFSCDRCHTPLDVLLSGRDADESCKKLWCDKCSTLMTMQLRPTLLTEESNALCYLDLDRCTLIDVLPTALMGVCGACQGEG